MLVAIEFFTHKDCIATLQPVQNSLVQLNFLVPNAQLSQQDGLMLANGTSSAGNFAHFVRTSLACLAIVAGLGSASAQDACTTALNDPTKLGFARTIAIDPATGPVIGQMTKLAHEHGFLAPKEIILTFDDGPLPWITRSILATLARHCTRATFFSVGKMALAYPVVLREELAQGHTVGTHTWSHPLNLKRLKPAAAEEEMERGFAAVSAAAGQPVAALFRFPGLSDSPSMVAHLAERHVATVTVDVVSNDSFINDPTRLTRETLAKIDANHGGIILFHDIKATTAKALPAILDALAARGYSVAHLVSTRPLEANQALQVSLEPHVARMLDRSASAKPAMVPFFGTTGPERANSTPESSEPPPSALPPPDLAAGSPKIRRKRTASHLPASVGGGGWSTRVQRSQSN